MQLPEWLARAANAHPDRDAVVEPGGRRAYGGLDEDAGRIARVLAGCGVRRGDRVVLALDNSHLWVAAFFGILRAGGVAVPLPARKNDRLGFVLQDCSPAACIVDDATAAAILEASQQPPRLLVVHQGDPEVIAARAGATAVPDVHGPAASSATMTAPGQPGLLAAMRHADVAGTVSHGADTDLAAIIYTSGSTGAPRGVMLSHRNLGSNADSIVQYLRLTSSDRVMVVLPFHYVYGLSLLTTHVSVGGSLAIDNRFAFPNVVLRSMQQFEVTGFAGVPSTFALLLHRSSMARMTFPSLRYVTQAGGPMPAPLLKRWLSILPGVPFFTMYGATEASARLAYLDPAELPARLGSIGKAIPNVELSVRGDDGQPVPPGEVGEIVARGPNIMLGYWNYPEETKAALGPFGYRTGDLARSDAEGFLYIVGRRQDMLKVGAERIGAKEIEDVVHEHPAVHEVAVVGAPHELLGEVPIAFVSLQTGSAVGPEEIQRFCGTRLADHKVPVHVVIQAELPKSPAGKIEKPQLRRLASELVGTT